MEWISVDDRLPDNDDEVLIYPTIDIGIDIIHGFYGALKRGEEKRFLYKYYIPDWGLEYYNHNVTHWMPLPPPPLPKTPHTKGIINENKTK